MAFSLLWLPQALKDAGLKVALVDGWENRGRREMGTVKGVICHYTAGQRKGNMPSLDTLIRGREESPGAEALPGPLAQLGLGRDGTYYVIAAGLANHAGLGEWQGITTGNTNFIGIEAENTGGHDDFPWPAVQVEAYHRGVAAILKHVGRGAAFCAGHKEYAPTRKQDPNVDMDEFRAAVASILNGTAPPPTIIPAAEPPTQPGGAAGRPTLRRGMAGPQVREIQLKLNVDPTGTFGPLTEAAIRDLQRARGLVPDGIVGPRTWAALDELS
jgi:Putative peptidoglycan binding domain/N-acetylmuramoyl-L-alanine amidase